MKADITQVRSDLDGFTGRFFYDAERGDIGWIAADCDAKHCDCEVKLNADGDQDCSHSLSDWEGEDHINEPIVRMLNAVPELLAEVERLRESIRLVRIEMHKENVEEAAIQLDALAASVGLS